MEIEMGENLFYSWLRHVKGCQIVQNNWKVSPTWEFLHSEEIEEFMNKAISVFKNKGYSLYGQSSSISQIIRQNESDALGYSFNNGQASYYAVDVAFHRGGIDYGDRIHTVGKIIAKTLRTAMCIWGFLDCTNAEVIFASPSIKPKVLNEINETLPILNDLFREAGLDFKGRLIANNDFNDKVLKPVMLVGSNIADLNELFVRACQMIDIFDPDKKSKSSKILTTEDDPYKEMKVGAVAKFAIYKILEQGKVTDEEIEKLQDSQYSSETFNISYPLLVRTDGTFNSKKYYVDTVIVNGIEYRVCSQWVESDTNNDRPYLLKWLSEHPFDATI